MENLSGKISFENALNLILAGNCTFTIKGNYRGLLLK